MYHMTVTFYLGIRHTMLNSIIKMV